jgi:hypothetical protein
MTDAKQQKFSYPDKVRRNKAYPEEGYMPDLDIVCYMSFEEIGKHLGISRQAAYADYKRALDKLKRRLKR